MLKGPLSLSRADETERENARGTHSAGAPPLKGKTAATCFATVRSLHTVQCIESPKVNWRETVGPPGARDAADATN